jgi:two-component system, NarL family, nitrate/nitrite response regulator NarL
MTHAPLSARERQVLVLLVEGLTYKQIATRLGVSIDRVKGVIWRVKDKLDAPTVYAAVAIAVRDDLLTDRAMQPPLW